MEEEAGRTDPIPPILVSLQFMLDSSMEPGEGVVAMVVVVVEMEEEEEVDDDKGNDGEKEASPSALAATGELVSGFLVVLLFVV